jgi:hypothetical protein
VFLKAVIIISAAYTIVELVLKHFFYLLVLYIYILLRLIILLFIDIIIARLIIIVVGIAISTTLSFIARGRYVLRLIAV